jgi:hypothetical protein
MQRVWKVCLQLSGQFSERHAITRKGLLEIRKAGIWLYKEPSALYRKLADRHGEEIEINKDEERNEEEIKMTLASIT